MKLVKRFRESLLIFGLWLGYIVGVAGLIIGVWDSVCEFSRASESFTEYPVFVALLGGLLTFLTSERIGLQEKTADDFHKILTHVSELRSIELVDGSLEITRTTIEAIRKATSKIRVTSFKRQFEIDKPSDDSTPAYYQALYETILAKNILYECAINANANNKTRFSEFESVKEQDKYSLLLNSMTFYEYQFMQRPLNLIIVDETDVFMGFYTNKYDLHMETVIKISNGTPHGKKIIDRLVKWYDAFVKPECGENKLVIEYSGKEYFDKLKSSQSTSEN